MNKNDVKALVITGFGLNCEKETAAAFRAAGATPEKVHLNDLLDGQRKLSEFHVLAFIGGFSFGDHIGAGTVFANRVKYRMRAELGDSAARQKGSGVREAGRLEDGDPRFHWLPGQPLDVEAS